MRSDRHQFILNNLSRLVLTGFVLFVLIFWQIGYPYTLFFQEPLQLFQGTWNYFVESIRLPGGLSGYLGEFFTQFYIFPLGGPLVLLLWLLLLQQFTSVIIKQISPGSKFYLISYLPAIWYCTILSEEFYLLSGLISVVIALAGVVLYMRMSSSGHRAAFGIILVPALFFLAGGSYILFLLSVMVLELTVYRKESSSREEVSVFILIFQVLIAALLPLIIRYYYDPVPFMQSWITEHFHKISTVFPFPVVLIWFFIPFLIFFVSRENHFRIKKGRIKWGVIFQFVLLVFVGYLGHMIFASPNAEQVKKFDYEVRHENWDEIISMAEEDLPRNAFAVGYLNLALAKTGQLGDRLFEFDQFGAVGLFLPYEREQLSAMIGNEAYYHIGLVNASQQYIFEATEAMPDLRKSARSLKRLTEVAIINGDYELARKYIHLLKQTFFYVSWAEEAESFLYDEDKINKHPDWGMKRKIRPQQDYFFSVDNIDQILIALLQDHPTHKMAFEYLMSGYLLNKDMGNFMKYIHLGHPVNYRYLPVSFQEAVLYVLGLKSRDAIKNNPFPIGKNTIRRMNQYVEIYTGFPNAEEILEEEFSDTFWFYYHFK